MTKITMPTTPATSRLKILGFPTQIRPGFIVFIALVVLLYGGTLGLWIGASLAVFTLIHELGHAVAARANGCVASISLNFMMAYAAYEPTRPLSWRQKIVIALAGSTSQVVAGLAILAAMQVNPFNYDSVTSSEASAAVWWSAIVLGLLNLIPLVPLDGGAVVSTILERLFPTRGRYLMLRFSVAITGAFAVLSFMSEPFRGFLPFALFLLFIQYQSLSTERLIRRGNTDPTGEPYIDAQVVAHLVDVGQSPHAIIFARRAFALSPNEEIAVQAARATATLGDIEATRSWLAAALATTLEPLSLLHAVNASDEIDAVKHHPDIESAIATIALKCQ